MLRRADRTALADEKFGEFGGEGGDTVAVGWRRGDVADVPFLVAIEEPFKADRTGWTGRIGAGGVAEVLNDDAIFGDDFGGVLAGEAGEGAGDFGEGSVWVTEDGDAVVVGDFGR